MSRRRVSHKDYNQTNDLIHPGDTPLKQAFDVLANRDLVNLN